MITIAPHLLGKGLYSTQEAAFLARVNTQTMSRWIFGNKTGSAAVKPQLTNDDDKTVTFVDFVQALAIRAIRTQYKISLEKIRQTVDVATEKGITFPFARSHQTYLFSDKQNLGHGEILLEVDGELIIASGKGRKTKVMPQIVEFYLDDLSFDPNTGLADSYTAFSHKGKNVVMNPKIRFGEPVVESCGYTAQTLWEAVQTEGSPDAAAKAYEVEKSDIETAYRFYDFLLNSDAA